LKPEHQIKGASTEDIIKEILRTVPVPTV